MAGNSRSSEQVLREIEEEREQLTGAVDSLRSGISEATNVGARLRSKLPVVVAGALGVGFVLGGGIGASVRLLMSGRRHGETKARFGRFSVVDRD